MNPTRFGIALTAALFAASALSGCSKVAEIKGVASGAAERVVASSTDRIVETVAGNLLTADGIDAAYSALSAEVGASPMQVVEVTILPEVLTVQAINPAAPTELNQWSFTAGVVAPPRPVDYDDDVEALQQNLFGVDEISSSAIATAIDGAVVASGVQGGELQSVVIKRNLPFDSNLTVLINVDGERSTKQVRADATGQITDVV